MFDVDFFIFVNLILEECPILWHRETQNIRMHILHLPHTGRWLEGKLNLFCIYCGRQEYSVLINIVFFICELWIWGHSLNCCSGPGSNYYKIYVAAPVIVKRLSVQMLRYTLSLQDKYLANPEITPLLLDPVSKNRQKANSPFGFQTFIKNLHGIYFNVILACINTESRIQPTIIYNSKLYIMSNEITQWSIVLKCRDVKKSIIKQLLSKSWHFSRMHIKWLIRLKMVSININWSQL